MVKPLSWEASWTPRLAVWSEAKEIVRMEGRSLEFHAVVHGVGIANICIAVTGKYYERFF